MPKVNDKFYHGALPARRAVLLALGWLLLTLPFATPEAAAITSITPVTWNVVGLDSNSPMAGPNRFPVGARVCSSDAETDFPVNFHWESDSDPTYINLTSSSPNPARIDIPAGGCADAYFEVEVLRSAASFEKARGYYIEAAGLETPRPRELYVKKLVSQARNGISALEYGTDPNNLKPVPAGESFPLEKGQTYYIRMSSYTAPGGYEQLETFSTLPTAIFQVLSVNTTYTADTTSNVSSPHDRLYADACYWESDPASPNYLACNGSGKIGGTMTVTYQVKIIDVGAGSNPIYSLVYDLSGASYHYNSDYSSSGRTALLVDPAAVTIDKRFAPATIAADGITTLIFTLTNPNGGAVSDVSFTDVFPDSPAALVVADPPNAVTSCVGTLYDSDGLALAAGDGGIRLTGGSIAGNSSCTVRVDVTAPSEDEYTNVSGNVWVGTVDTGDNATATLIVDNGYLPTPTPPSACTTRVEMARWNFDNLAAGSNFTPNSSFKDVDVATAAASIHNPARLTTSTISSAQSVSAANSWAAGGTNNNNTTGWQRGGSPTPAELPPGPTDAAFQFSVDSSKFGDVKIRFQGIRDTQWTGTNNYVRVHASGDNGTSWASAEITGLASNNWSVFTPALSTNGADTTLFRINAYYRGTNANAAGALMYLDDIIIDGCQLPDPPKIAKEFAPATVAVGESTTLNFVVTNPNAPKPGNTTGQPLAGISFEDTLPAGMTVTSGSTTVCGGTLTRTAPNLIAFSGGTLAAPASPATSTTCTIPVTVTATQAGSHDNVSGFIAADYAGSNTDPDGYATATLTVLAPPQIAKEFDPPIIYTSAQGSVATLTFTLVNPNPNHPLTDVAFTDTFPAGLVVANPPLTDNSCGGTLSDSSGAALGVGDVGIRLTGATIAAGGTCTVSVDVTSADPDYYENTSGAVTHTLNGADWGTDTAYAALLVIEPTPAIALSKQVGPGTYGPWAAKLIVGPGGDVVYRFTVENIGDVPLSNVSLSDPAAWVDPSTCVWADGDGDPLTAPFDLPVATAANDKHIAVCTLDPITAALSGEHPNTATAEGSWTGETATDFSTATYAISTLALLKSVAESYYTSAGTVLNYTYTVTNNGAASLTAPLTLTDNRIATVTCGSLAPDNELAPNESVICTATYTVTADDVAAGSITNVARALINGVYSPQAIVTVERVGLPSLLFLKSRQTFSDPVNGTSTPKPIPGAYVDYTLLVSNSGEGPAQSLVITDPIPANTQLFVGDLGQGGPVLFSDPDSDSGFAAPQPFTLSYSEDADCESYNYTPTADADGFDANVCRLRIAMDGSMSGTADPADPADFSLTFRVRID